MNQNKTGLGQISWLLVGVFFVSCLYMNIFITFDGGYNQTKAVVIADYNGMEVFQHQLTDGKLKASGLPGTEQIKSYALKCGEKLCKLLLQITYGTMFFMISGVLYLEGKGRLFVCFMTFLFHKARFLCELFIRKKKDGKKWIPVF